MVINYILIMKYEILQIKTFYLKKYAYINFNITLLLFYYF